MAAFFSVILAPSLPALDIFTITSVQDDGVVVTDVQADYTKKDGPDFRDYEIFDVYTTRLESGFTGFVDSLYRSPKSVSNLDLRYTWKGEKKYIKTGYFVVRTGRMYQVQENPMILAAGTSSNTAARVTPAPTYGVPTLNYPGSFGMAGMEVTATAGAGLVSSVYASDTLDLTPAMILSTKLRYGMFGASARFTQPFGSTPYSPSRFSLSAYLDFYLDILTFLGLQVSGGISVSPNALGNGLDMGGGVCFGVYGYIPLGGDESSFMPYVELIANSPSIGGAYSYDYIGLCAGVRF